MKKSRRRKMGVESLESRVVLSADPLLSFDVVDHDHDKHCHCVGTCHCHIQIEDQAQDHSHDFDHDHSLHEQDHEDSIEFPKNWQGGFYQAGPEDTDPNPLTVILDFNDPTQANTTDGIGNVVSTFDVTSYGFSVSDFDLVANSVLAKVQEHYHDIQVNLPSGEQLSVEFEIGNVGTPPINGSNDYYYLQIGSRTGSGGPLGQASGSSIRNSSGNPGAAVGSVVGSTFTDNINVLSNLTPSNALTSGNLEFTTNAIAGTTSHEVGHALSLRHINKAGTSTPTGLPPIMGTGAIDLPNQDRILERDFSTNGVNAQNGGATQMHVDQLESAVDTAASALPFNLTSADRGDAHLFPNSVSGEIVDDTFERSIFIDSGGDVDGVFYAPQRSGNHVISVGDFANAVDPIVAVYDAETGAKLSFNNDLTPFLNDDSRLVMPMDAFSRYIVAVADVGSNTTGDLEVTINPPGTGSVPTPIIAIDSLGFGTQPILIGSGDIDGFKATVPIGSTELTVDITDRSFDAAVVVWDTSGNVLGRVDNGNPRLLTIPGLTAGSEVIITVAGDHFDSSGTGTMVLDFGLSGLAVTTTTAEQDAVDFPASGGDLVNNTTSNFPLRMDSNGDIDSVYYAPQSSGTHTIAVGDFGNIVDPVVAIYDSTGARIAIDDDSGPDDDALLSVNLNRWERYVIAILDQGNNSTGDVELVINGPVQTTSISVFVDSTTGDGGSSSQLLDATGDVDHYRFVAPESASGNLTVDISPTIGLDVAAVLWDSAGNLISRSDSAGIGLDETLFTNSVSPGQEFYVSVRSSEYASSGNFDLDINFETVPTFEEIVFAGSLANGQVELLRSNGSNNQGTGLLKNVGGSVSSNPHELTVVGSELFFAATGADGEVELFKTKANGATARVKDFAGAISSDPHELTEYNGRLYFVATGADGETELMVSNGTNSGTVRVKDLSGATSSDPADLTVMNGLLYFTAFDTVGQRELYVSDGTGPGTRRVLNLYGNGTSADPKELTVVGNTLFFTANTPAGGRELHSSTGAPAGTGLVKDIPGVNGNPSLLTEYAGDLYYRARNTGGQIELWKSDGTSAGTNELIDLYGAGTISNPRRFTQLGGKLYFVARTPAGGAELHVTNGTAGGTLLVKDLHGVVNADPKDLTVLGSQLMFSALGADGERELYTSDGTNAGTSRLKDLSGAVSSNPQNLTAVGNSLYFSATTAVGEVELFRSDGTTAGTSLVKNLGGSPAPHEIVAFDINLPVTSPSTGGIDAQSIGLSDGDSRLPKPAELIQAESRNTDRILDNVFALAEVDDDEESEEKFAWTQGYDDLLVFESI